MTKMNSGAEAGGLRHDAQQGVALAGGDTSAVVASNSERTIAR
jgi:hypothetical protein